MNPIDENTAFEGIMEAILTHGPDGFLPAMKVLFDFTMQHERA